MRNGPWVSIIWVIRFAIAAGLVAIAVPKWYLDRGSVLYTGPRIWLFGAELSLVFLFALTVFW